MAIQLVLQNLMKLARGIGANPGKFVGTKTNISFLGKGPTSNILFQNPVRIKNYLRNRGSDESVLGEINDAMGFATAGKLNPIQLEILNDNLIKIATIMKPSALPSLPSASVTPIAPGITGVKRLIKEGKIEDAWRKFDKGYKGNPDEGMAKFYPEAYKYNTKSTRAGERLYNKITGLDKPRLVRDRLPEPGPGDRAPYMGALNIKTGMSRAIARNLLLKDTRLKLSSDDLFMLKEGKGEPLDLMAKYYGRSMSAYDDFLNQVNLEAARPDEFAAMILKNVKLTPQFAEGGLARILEV